MTYTLLTLTLVGITLLFWLYHLMNNCFSRSFCILKNRKTGSTTTKEASIISVSTIKQGKKPLLELMVLFENFSGYYIHRKIRVWDTKPHLERFKPDKTIPVGLNVARKPKDPIFLSQEMCRFSFAMVVLCVIKLIIFVSGSYILMGEALEKIFSARYRYEGVFKTSTSWEMGLIFIGISVLLYFLLQKVGVVVNGKTMEQNWNLLYYGVGTKAAVVNYKHAGTSIKKDPVFHFSYVFKNHWGQKIEGVDKKILEKTDTASPSEIDQLEVMYLPNEPSVSRITENLESQDFIRFLNKLFLMVVFVFSVVFILSFYQDVFG
ncbi:hypothetical protein [Flagellimonas crocea]|uniref:hypothetical protein n=1 Tax=Flagellimonas crocea TaxID=3067311 RepID=UPI00296F8459|nr:hypothetical protein [Muricauda sp. DH64]